jgi:hypothetical protein
LYKKIVRIMLMKLTPMVNFINFLCTNFTYETLFDSLSLFYLREKRKAAEKTFVRKICEFNVEEIDIYYRF